MKVEILTASDPRWHGVLARVQHDVYHRPEYVLFDAEHQAGEAVAFYAIDSEGDEFLLPMVTRPLPSRLQVVWRDAASPYGYPALVATTAEPARINHFLRHMASVAREHGIISLFLRWHPVLSPGERSPIEHEAIVEHGETVYVVLAESADEWNRQTRSGHRYEIRTLRRNGFRVVVDDWSQLPAFHEIYMQTMRRVAAQECYEFSLAQFQQLYEALGNGLHIASVLSPAGDIAASGLFTQCCGIAQYYLSGSDRRFSRVAPTKLLLDEIRIWAKAQGCRVFHLGGGLGGRNDSLLDFKAGFSNWRSTYRTSRIITDPARYQLAVAAASDASGTTDGGFFPSYRRAA